MKAYLTLLAIFVLSGAAYILLANVAPTTIVVKWETANEVNTAGFNVYRSQSRAGPLLKLNSQLLPASTDPLSGGQYRYEDSNVTPGQTYYYHVEDVEYSGASTRHGPIVITAPSVWDLSNGPTVLMLFGLVFLAVISVRVYRTRQ